MKPIIALVGRPNVGKSTLFNKLTRSRDALVADHAGLTRDRIYGTAEIEGCSFIIIDTGGLTERSDDMSGLMRQQAQLAIEEADLIFFLVDGRAGLTAADEDVAIQLRNADKPVILVVNKAEGERREMMAADFYKLGLGEPQVISATQNRGFVDLMAAQSTHSTGWNMPTCIVVTTVVLVHRITVFVILVPGLRANQLAPDVFPNLDDLLAVQALKSAHRNSSDASTSSSSKMGSNSRSAKSSSSSASGASR